MKNKKIYIVIGLIFLVVLTFTGIYAINSNKPVDNNNDNNVTQNAFIGYIEKITGDTGNVKVIEGNILSSGDSVNVNLQGYTFEVGTKVKVIYDGNVMETYPLKIKTLDIEKVEYPKISKLYMTLIDDLIGLDQALNSDMEYIAINIESFDILNEQQQDIIHYLYKYHDNIKVASYQDLKEQGLVISTSDVIPHIDGILIDVGNIEKKNDNHYIVNMQKYRSALGAIFPEYEAKYKDGIWSFEIKSMAIS